MSYLTRILVACPSLYPDPNEIAGHFGQDPDPSVNGQVFENIAKLHFALNDKKESVIRCHPGNIISLKKVVF